MKAHRCPVAAPGKPLFRQFRKPLYHVVGGDNAQFTRLAQVGNALPVVAQEDTRQSPVEIGFRKIRVQLDGLVIIRQSRPVVLQQREHVAPVVIGVDKVRCQAYDLVQVFLHNLLVQGRHAAFSLRAGDLLSGILPQSSFRFPVLQILVTHQ